MSSKSVPEARPAALSLAGRLTAWYGVSAFLLIAASAGFLYWSLLAQLDREDDEFLADKINIVRALLRDHPGDLAVLREQVLWEPAARQHEQLYVRILDAGGRAIMETPGMEAVPAPAGAPAVDGVPPHGIELELPTGKSFRVVIGSAGGTGAVKLIQVAMDRTREEEVLAGYRRALWLALSVALAVCLLVGFQLARRGLRPLAVMGAAVARVRSTTLYERIPNDRLPGELAGLAGAFNETLDRLEESFDRLARFSADIAHELRTPVQNLRGEIEVLLGAPRSADEYREGLASCLEECGRLSRLIDNLLFIARAESPSAQLKREPVDVDRELAALCDYYEPAASEAGVALAARAPAHLGARVDRALFQRALGNLIENALAHTPHGGSVTLSACQSDGSVSVEVADTGQGIPPEHLPHIFDRFYRADPARTASATRSGLGLAIVQSIVALHRGTASATSQPGKGTRVTLTFPIESHAV
jgi:two-component system heavy metal sensor histidine kinase CusS